MSFPIRYVIMVFTNLFLWMAMLIWLDKNGIDALGTTIADHADNMAFVFDFLFFIVISFSANLAILSWPSKTQQSIGRLLAIIEEQQRQTRASANSKRHKRRPA